MKGPANHADIHITVGRERNGDIPTSAEMQGPSDLLLTGLIDALVTARRLCPGVSKAEYFAAVCTRLKLGLQNAERTEVNVNHTAFSMESQTVMVILDGFGVRDTDTLRQRLASQAGLARRVERLEAERTPAKPILCNSYLACGSCERSLRLEWKFCPYCGKKVMRPK